jgi:CheY-like chemotaxis protein
MGEARRVLLAEDDRFLRKAAETALKRHGFAVVPAVDGEEALRLARAEPPDLVLLDLIMPKMQGFEVLRALKADPGTAPDPGGDPEQPRSGGRRQAGDVEPDPQCLRWLTLLSV